MTPEEITNKITAAINARFAELTKMEADCQQGVLGKQADLNAIVGAKMDCQYWLSQVPTLMTPPTFVPDTNGPSIPGATSDNANDSVQ